MKKILFIDDDLTTLLSETSILEEGGYSVDRISSIAQADDLLENGRIKIYDCLIIDLNMNNKYLGKEFLCKDLQEKFKDRDLIKETHGGIFTGWVWLYNYAKPKLVELMINPKIIIYSQFIIELTDEMETASDEERNYYYGVETITKAEMVHNPERLLEKVNKLFNKGEQ
jgi:hypothetical protein